MQIAPKDGFQDLPDMASIGRAGRFESGRFPPEPGGDASTAQRVTDQSDYIDIQVNTFQTCALTEQGKLWCWGFNEWGELGLGDTVQRGTPTAILTETSWREMAIGRQHHCALQLDGSIWCAGRSYEGQIGSGVVAASVPEFQRVRLP